MAAKSSATKKTSNRKSTTTRTKGSATSTRRSNSNSSRSDKTAPKREVTRSANDKRYLEKNDDIRRNIVLSVSLALAIIIMIGNFGGGGIILTTLSSFFFGLFGLIEYILPVLIFGSLLFFYANKASTLKRRVFSFYGFIIAIAIFFECFDFSFSPEGTYTPALAYTHGFDTAGGFELTGGFVGGLFVYFLGKLGFVPALIIAAVLMVITFILFTGLTPWTMASEIASRQYEDNRYIASKKKEVRDQKREARRRERIDNKVRGITADTDLLHHSSTISTDDMHEIDPDDPKFKVPVDQEVLATMSSKPVNDPMLGKYNKVALEPEKDVLKASDKPVLPNDVFDEDQYNELSSILVAGMAEIKVGEHVKSSDNNDMDKFSPELAEKFATGSLREKETSHIPKSELSDEATKLMHRDTQPIKLDPVDIIERIEDIPESDNTSLNNTVETDVATDNVVYAEPIKPEEDLYSDDFIENDSNVPEIDIVSSTPDFCDTEEIVEDDSDMKEYVPNRNNTIKKNPAQSIEEQEAGIEEVAEEIAAKEEIVEKPYVFPPIDILTANTKRSEDSSSELRDTAEKLHQTLKNFGVNVTVEDVVKGPTVTRFEIKPELGTKVQKIVNLTDDLRLNLAATDIRIEAPIPGKSAIGIEIPNKSPIPVMFRDLVESDDFKKHPSPIAFGAGMDIDGNIIMADIAKMPHLLIAGTTGSGKSVCINSIIMSILYKADPKDVKLIMIDPKMVELNVYNNIPHLLIPVVTDSKKAAGALCWAVDEMMNRYKSFKSAGVRDLAGYNEKAERILRENPEDKTIEKLPKIVIVVDEFADLMMVAPGEVEESVCRIAQLARACGIHLILATQRPTANVITGLIKANVPSRIAFAVASGTDSRIVLDTTGAERLLGHGDMLYFPQGASKPTRSQGAFVPDADVFAVTDFIEKNNGGKKYDDKINEAVETAASQTNQTKSAAAANDNVDDNGRDEYFERAGRVIIEKEKASIGVLQRALKVGFNRAARIMDQLEEAGVVGPECGTKPREIRMSAADFDRLIYQTDET